MRTIINISTFSSCTSDSNFTIDTQSMSNASSNCCNTRILVICETTNSNRFSRDLEVRSSSKGCTNTRRCISTNRRCRSYCKGSSISYSNTSNSIELVVFRESFRSNSTNSNNIIDIIINAINC